MKSRALFWMAALLGSSAWAQVPSFDLKSDAIRKIVHDTAASQSALVQLAEAKPLERKWVLGTEDLRFVETPHTAAPPTRVAKPKRQGPVSALLDTVIDTVVSDALGLDEMPVNWINCRSPDDNSFSRVPIENCPGPNHGLLLQSK